MGDNGIPDTNYLWITNDGERIRIEDMKHTHLIKSLIYFGKKKVNWTTQERLSAIKEELERRFYLDLVNL